jgi:hypothetical protein
MWIESEPGQPLRDVWAYLTPEEAAELLRELRDWAEREDEDAPWHWQIADGGRLLSIAIHRDGARGRFARRVPPPARRTLRASRRSPALLREVPESDGTRSRPVRRVA